MISRHRRRKNHRKDDGRRNSRPISYARHSEQRNSYASYISRSEKQRQPEARLAVHIRPSKFQEEFSVDKQRESFRSHGSHEKRLPTQVVHEVYDDEDFNDKEVIVSTGELVSIERAGRPIERNLDNKKRSSILPKGWFSDKNNGAPVISTDEIGVAS